MTWGFSWYLNSQICVWTLQAQCFGVTPSVLVGSPCTSIVVSKNNLQRGLGGGLSESILPISQGGPSPPGALNFSKPAPQECPDGQGGLSASLEPLQYHPGPCSGAMCKAKAILYAKS